MAQKKTSMGGMQRKVFAHWRAAYTHAQSVADV